MTVTLPSNQNWCDIQFSWFQALRQEISYAVHLSLPAVHVSLKSYNCTNLARHINNIIMSTNVQQVSESCVLARGTRQGIYNFIWYKIACVCRHWVMMLWTDWLKLDLLGCCIWVITHQVLLYIVYWVWKSLLCPKIFIACSWVMVDGIWGWVYRV